MKSPFVPFLVGWAAVSIGGFFVLRAYVPLHDVWLAFIALNAATFLLYGLDKMISGSGLPRVPERLLQLTALLGSPVGALAAMWLFHHKTRKISFQFWLALVLLLQAVALYVWLRK